MKTRHTTFWPRRAGSRDGAILVTVMLISGVLMLSATAMMALASNASFRMRRLTAESKALSIAESGIAYRIAQLSHDYGQYEDYTNTTDYAEGAFHVVSQTLPGAFGAAVGSVLVTSVGTVGAVARGREVSRTTVIELLGTDRDRNDMLFSLEGAILSGGDVRFRTAAFSINGHVHSNQEITSASGAENGDFLPPLDAEGNPIGNTCYITAVGDIGNLTATLVPGTEERDMPDFNFDSYRQMAIEGGIYLEGDQVLRNLRTIGTETHWFTGPGNNTGTSQPTGNGIFYVNGNAQVSNGNNEDYTGTLVVNGDITLSNQYSHEPAIAGMPGILATGNVTLNNNGSIGGLVYAGVNVLIQNNVDVRGGIISVGYTDINNRSQIFNASGQPPWDPMQPEVPPEVIVGGWLR